MAIAGDPQLASDGRGPALLSPRLRSVPVAVASAMVSMHGYHADCDTEMQHNGTDAADRPAPSDHDYPGAKFVEAERQPLRRAGHQEDVDVQLAAHDVERGRREGALDEDQVDRDGGEGCSSYDLSMWSSRDGKSGLRTLIHDGRIGFEFRRDRVDRGVEVDKFDVRSTFVNAAVEKHLEQSVDLARGGGQRAARAVPLYAHLVCLDKTADCRPAEPFVRFDHDQAPTVRPPRPQPIGSIDQPTRELEDAGRLLGQPEADEDDGEVGDKVAEAVPRQRDVAADDRGRDRDGEDDEEQGAPGRAREHRAVDFEHEERHGEAADHEEERHGEHLRADGDRKVGAGVDEAAKGRKGDDRQPLRSRPRQARKKASRQDPVPAEGQSSEQAPAGGTNKCSYLVRRSNSALEPVTPVKTPAHKTMTASTTTKILSGLPPAAVASAEKTLTLLVIVEVGKTANSIKVASPLSTTAGRCKFLRTAGYRPGLTEEMQLGAVSNPVMPSSERQMPSQIARATPEALPGCPARQFVLRRSFPCFAQVTAPAIMRASIVRIYAAGRKQHISDGSKEASLDSAHMQNDDGQGHPRALF